MNEPEHIPVLADTMGMASIIQRRQEAAERLEGERGNSSLK